MKILEQREWGTEHTCPGCTSKLLVEASDIRFKYTQDLDGVTNPCYYAECPVCRTTLYLAESKLPFEIKKRAEAKNRAPSY